MDIREGKTLCPMSGKEVMIFSKNELNTGMLQWADQIICGTNATRININNQMRELIGRTGGPKDGDKIICLRNYWEIFSDNGDPLINGTIGTLSNSFETFYQLPFWAGGRQIPIIVSNFDTDGSSYFNSLNMDKNMIMTGEPVLDWQTNYKLGKNPNTAHLVPLEFTYGYAITCHKSQGSEYEKALVIEEKFPFKKEEHTRWLYTAATRASSKLVIIQS